MNKRVKEKWIDRLRNGGLRQGEGYLRGNDGEIDEYCCLGVLCEIAVEEGVIAPPKFDDINSHYYYAKKYDQFLPKTVAGWAGLNEDPEVVIHHDGDYDETDTLASLNDSGRTFAEIATYIEEGL